MAIIKTFMGEVVFGDLSRGLILYHSDRGQYAWGWTNSSTIEGEWTTKREALSKMMRVWNGRLKFMEKLKAALERLKSK